MMKPKRNIWEDKEGNVTSDETLPLSVCPAAIYAYPLEEDKKARYNCWFLGSEDDVGEKDSIGIIFETCESTWVNIGTWAFGSDFVTRKRPIRWCDFKDEAEALTNIAYELGVSEPNIFDIISNHNLFTKNNFNKLGAKAKIPDNAKALFEIQFLQLSSFYSGGFEVCVMEDVPPNKILAWVDFEGVTDSEAWYDKGLNNKRIKRVSYHNKTL